MLLGDEKPKHNSQSGEWKSNGKRVVDKFSTRHPLQSVNTHCQFPHLPDVAPFGQHVSLLNETASAWTVYSIPFAIAYSFVKSKPMAVPGATI